MIPQKLTLKNFLSYREASLDFRGLHTACICGANGAGKSSLLEAIAWAVWGQSRAASEDDVIHQGAAEAQVNFVFINQQNTYRIIRSRHRGQATSLEFQIALAPATPQSPWQFRSITAKGVRATQQLILDHLKLDYDTFINSAYLRQGRADEFMLKRPGERKQILAELLKLNQYDDLAERAKDRSRQLKGQLELLERNLQTIQAQLQEGHQIEQERLSLEAILTNLQAQQQTDLDRLQTLQAFQQQRQTWQQQLTWQQQQQRTLEQDWQRLQQEWVAAQHQQQELEGLLQQQEAIATAYTQFQTLQADEESFSGKFKTYQIALGQRQLYQQQQAETESQIQGRLQHLQAQLAALEQQEAEIQHTLSKATEVEAALQQLHQARAQLHHLDQLQAQVSPLLQRQQQLQTQVDRQQSRLTARLEELHHSVRQLQTQQQSQPQLQQSVSLVSDRITQLESKRAYQQQVREKGLERRSFMERLQSRQREYETQLAELEQKMQLLGGREPAGESGLRAEAGTEIELALQAKASVLGLSVFPPCPLCDRPLDEHHWNLVLQKHQTEQQEILDQIWVIREQLSVSEREIQILRQEYKELELELAQYGSVLERRGQLQAQLQVSLDSQETLQQLLSEVTTLEQSLQTGDYAIELLAELRLLEQSLQEFNYDERDHALARGEVDRWRWAEIRQAEMRQAQRRQAQIQQQRPELQSQLASLQASLERSQREARQHLAVLDQQIAQIGYNLDYHNQLRQAVREAQAWQLRYQDLLRAQQHYPQVQQRLAELAQVLQQRQQALHTTQNQALQLIQQLEQAPDCQAEVQSLEEQMQQRRSHLDQQFAHLGRLQQQQQQLDSLSRQHADLNIQLQITQRQYRVYQELAQAFGKNGIQALMIENALPQLEAETNQILSRLSGNQLHVQFVTQRAGKGSKATSKSNPRLIDTLDILIADAQGTRPYETYSGGEAFRVNFAIRLAMARLLAQRSGMALQLLIVDEGFGTQDAEGCNRLIAAINAIAADFACILAVTHVPHLKEAFQSRIEVFKTEAGSQLRFSM